MANIDQCWWIIIIKQTLFVSAFLCVHANVMDAEARASEWESEKNVLCQYIKYEQIIFNQWTTLTTTLYACMGVWMMMNGLQHLLLLDYFIWYLFNETAPLFKLESPPRTRYTYLYLFFIFCFPFICCLFSASLFTFFSFFTFRGKIVCKLLNCFFFFLATVSKNSPTETDRFWWKNWIYV